MYMYSALVFMYIYLEICHCLFFRSNLNKNVYNVVLEYTLKALDIYKVGRKATVS